MINKLRQLIGKIPLGGRRATGKYVPYMIPMIGTPPYRFEGLTNFSMYLDSSKDLLTSEENLVDKYLNQPLGCSGNKCIYRAAKLDPLLIFSEVNRSFSIPDSKKSKTRQAIAYQEVSLIIPVVIDDRKLVGYFMPILFVDGPPGADEQWQGSVPIVIGRERYGLPKVRARIEFEYDGQKITRGAVSWYGKEVLTVTATTAHPEEDTSPLTGPQRHKFAERIFGKITPNRDFTAGTTAGGHTVDLVHVGHGNPLVGLRQVRDVTHLETALYRDVVESPYIVDPPTMPSPLGNALTINFDLSSGLFDGLNLQEEYKLPYPTDGVVYAGVAANFGDPAATTVRQSES